MVKLGIKKNKEAIRMKKEYKLRYQNKHGFIKYLLETDDTERVLRRLEEILNSEDMTVIEFSSREVE